MIRFYRFHMTGFAALFMIVLCTCSASVNTPPVQTTSEFEGVIRYTIEALSATRAGKEAIRNGFGDKATLYYKQGKCRMTFNGNELNEVFYLPESNTEYTKLQGIDSLFFGVCDQVDAELETITERRKGMTLLGHDCDCLDIRTEKYTRRLCYWPALHVDPTPFARYKTAYYNEYYGRARSPFLYNEYDGKHFRYAYRAVEVEPKALPDSVFRLPDLPHKEFKDH